VRRSLAWRLATRYLIALSALLFASAGFQYFALRHFLLTAASARLAAAVRQPLADYASELAGGVAPSAAAESLVRAIADPQTLAWVIGDGGGVLAEAAGPAHPRPPGTASSQQPLLAPVPSPPPRPRPGHPQIVGGDLVLTAPLAQGPGSGAATLVVATRLQDVFAVLGSEVRLLVWGGVAALAVGGASGLLGVRQALRPLRAIAATADRITAGDLQVRAGQADAPEEVAHLARAFDAMVDRLAAAIADERATHQQMRRFLDDASHQLRTPLTALSGTLEVLQGDAGADPEAVRDGLRSAHRQARRLNNLVSGLLALARAERPEGLILQLVDVGEVLVAIRPAAERLAADHRLCWVAPAEPLPVLANADLLGGAVLSVLDNAVRYTGFGTEIRVEARRDGGVAEVSVADRGPGIAPEHLPHVFDRFYRCPPGADGPSPAGTGLGLAIVRSVMERHRGTALIESARGEGTTVRLRLPLRPAPPRLP
jgi:two-component system OmpR family sensor kinase